MEQFLSGGKLWTDSKFPFSSRSTHHICDCFKEILWKAFWAQNLIMIFCLFILRLKGDLVKTWSHRSSKELNTCICFCYSSWLTSRPHISIENGTHLLKQRSRLEIFFQRRLVSDRVNCLAQSFFCCLKISITSGGVRSKTESVNLPERHITFVSLRPDR